MCITRYCIVLCYIHVAYMYMYVILYRIFVAKHGCLLTHSRPTFTHSLPLSLSLQVHDELLEINGNSTEGMLHSDAITIIKHGGDIVRLIVRRVSEHARQFSKLNNPCSIYM